MLAVLCLVAQPAAAEIGPGRAGELAHMVTQDCGSCHGLTLKGALAAR
ncbi:MAG: hypothetical protein HZT43_01545 [Exiguobacterium profundum]|nr:MAG: hypothetical protein HZT43_01545 [Exiguobacterium profundum]